MDKEFVLYAFVNMKLPSFFKNTLINSYVNPSKWTSVMFHMCYCYYTLLTIGYGGYIGVTFSVCLSVPKFHPIFTKLGQKLYLDNV